MKKLVAIFLLVILAGSVTIPNVFSDSENKSTDNDNNQNDDNANQSETKVNDTADDKENKIHFGFSNATSVNITLPNGTTVTFGFSNGTNVGQQISTFIHHIREAFKQQETQAKQIIKDCRDKAKETSNPTDKKNIMNQCKAQLKQINQQFSSEHKQLQLDFKQFREMVIGNNQEDHEKPEKDNDTKISNTTQVILPHVLEQKKSHVQNTPQNTIPPNPQGIDGKQKHGKQTENQKRVKED